MEPLTKNEIGWLISVIHKFQHSEEVTRNLELIELCGRVKAKLNKMYSASGEEANPYTTVQEMKLEPSPRPLQFSFEVKLGDTYLTRLQFVPEREVISYEAIQLLENAINQFYKYCMEKQP